MTVKETLDIDLKDAMRQKDAIRRTVIRTLRSEIHNQEIEDHKELDDDGAIRVLAKQAQQRRDSIEAFGLAERDDLVQREKAELAIILGYLPEQLTSDEVTEIVRASIEQVGAAGPEDMGKVMGAVMPQIRGRAEGREVNRIASEMLKGMGE
ncbi:MAG: GatB/YqeY domain-containing protein [Chloroflexi bacterium]|nr:GatB/YqeY domain-containing protein [Chloroflexota bacterium]